MIFRRELPWLWWKIKDSTQILHELQLWLQTLHSNSLLFGATKHMKGSNMLGLTFSSKLYWNSYIISIGKTTSKKIWTFIHSIKFLSPEVALYHYKSTMRPCLEYRCHVWAGAPRCYSASLDKLQKQIFRTVGRSCAASFEPLAHCWNVANLCLFYWYIFVRCSSELTQLVSLP